MTKTRDIIARAYRKLGVSASGESLDADYVTEGVQAVNAMLHGFKLRGVDFEHTDIASSDDFPLDAEYHEGVVYLLASRLSPDYEIPLSFDADEWFRTFQAARISMPTSAMPGALTNLPSSGHYDELT